MTAIDASVVVCAYNRTGGRFRYEVVVVDNASTDDTADVIAQAAREWPELVHGVYEPRRGVSCARNRGVREARGPWIAFFDDDQVAEPDWLLALLSGAEAVHARCLGGAVRLLLPGEALAALPAECRTLLGESLGRNRRCRYGRKTAPGTGNLLVHRSVFEQVGGFDESLREAGEDTDLYRRIRQAGIEAWYLPEAVVRHVTPPYRLTAAYLRWRFLRFGSQLARRDRHEWGWVGFFGVLAARLVQVAVQYLPRWLAAQLGRSPRRRLAARCPFWRAEGYFRFALAGLAPRRFAQRDFFATLDFRGERELFDCGQTPAAQRVGTP
jgi:GT2 family glycosyltransferase